MSARWRAIAYACLVAGCAHTPVDPQERALYGDLRKIVSLAEGADWIVDRLEVDGALTGGMESICRAEPEARLGVLRFIDHAIADEGGPAADRLARNGGDLSEVREALRLERIGLVLRTGMARAGEDCPFWLPPNPEFRGVQSDEERLVLWLESIGGFGLVVRGDEVELGGGGGGRVLLGLGFDNRVTAAFGLELGAIASFPESSGGARQLQATFGGALPFVLRLRDTLRVIDFEIAPTVRYVEDEIRFPPGVRVAIGAGISGTRTGGVMPHGLLWIGYEYRPPLDGGLPEHSVRLGTRVGIDWDP